MDGPKLHLQGELKYDNQSVKIDKVADIKSYPGNDRAFALNFREDRYSEGLNLIHAKLTKNANMEDLDLPEKNEKLLGKDIITLVFMNSNTNEIFAFEEELHKTNSIALKSLTEIGIHSLDEEVAPGWAWKLFEPYKFDIELIGDEVGENKGESQFDLNQSDRDSDLEEIRYQCTSRQCLRDFRATYHYLTYYGEPYESHSMDVRVYTRYEGNRDISTSAEVLNKFTDINGRRVQGSSIVVLGSYNNPVAHRITLSNDRLTRITWTTSNADTRSNFGNFGIGFSYLIFSYGIEIFGENGLNLSGHRNISVPVGERPNENHFSHNDSRLRFIGNRYDVSYLVASGTGSYEVAFWLPFYEGAASNTFETVRPTLSVNF